MIPTRGPETALQEILAACDGNEKIAATRAGISVAKLRSLLKKPNAKPIQRTPLARGTKPVRTRGPRARSWTATRLAYLSQCVRRGDLCPDCGAPITLQSQVPHFVPRSLAPELATDPDNLGPPLCATHSQPEDARGVKANALRRYDVILSRYGRRAARYLKRNWPGRRPEEWAEDESRAAAFVAVLVLTVPTWLWGISLWAGRVIG